MNNPRLSVALVTAGMLIFTILCNSRFNIPSEYLFASLVLLHIGIVWMVITIFKYNPSSDSYSDSLQENRKN